MPPSSPAASSTSNHLPDPYIVGSEFPNLETARKQLKKVTIQRGLSYKRAQHDYRRYVVRCRNPACPFRLRFTIKRGSGIAKTTVFHPHSCPPETHRDWKALSSVEYLSETHRNIIEDDPSTKASKIIALEKARGNNISYKQGWRALKHIQEIVSGASGDDGRNEESSDPSSSSAEKINTPSKEKNNVGSEQKPAKRGRGRPRKNRVQNG
ncbi:hypothetical protein VTN31DRAFT_5599 [Thermomyces dupontii]|uniref:uncharacterized protein n=1 Tax=Talaromyces thermophilus TaxID=28565 RepID=UPI0037427C11